MRVLGTVALAILLLGGGAVAQSPSVEPASGHQEVLGFTFPDGSSRARLVLIRTTLEPGERLAGVGWGGSSVSWIESGSLTVLVEAGTIRVGGPGEDGGMVADGDSWTGDAFDTVLGGPATRMAWTNDDGSRVTVLTTAILPEDGGDGTSLPGGSPTPTETPVPKQAPPVVRTIVVRGTGPVGLPATYTIRDQSGWVVGARVPDEREMRSWPRELLGATPVRATGRDTFDLLVTWSGGGCGPNVTLTVAPRLRSMRLVDRSPGCDASAMGHWLLLQLRTTVGIPVREIPFETVRRRS